MSRTTIFKSMATALVYVCALLAIVGSAPAPPKRPETKESKIVLENTIVVRRMPNAYFYPFSLWPLPKFQSRDNEDGFQTLPYRSIQNTQRRWIDR